MIRLGTRIATLYFLADFRNISHKDVLSMVSRIYAIPVRIESNIFDSLMTEQCNILALVQ